MDGMDIEITDAEDAACDMGQLSSYFGRRGQYEEAAMVDGAARRLRADAEDIARLTRERDEAVRVLVWALKHKAIGYADRISYAVRPQSWSLRREVDHDGTDADIYRALREAMGVEGVRGK